MADTYTVDGFPTRVGFADLTANAIVLPGTIILEREVKLPKVEIGEIDIKTMRNSLWRPKVAKQLRSVGDITIQCLYDPQIYQLLFTHIGIYTRFAIALPAGSTNVAGTITFTRWLVFYKAWIDSIDPQAHKEGELPTMELVVKPTMLTTNGAITSEQGSGTVYSTSIPF